MYTLESLKPLNASFDVTQRLDQSDVEMVNRFVKLIESTRREKPCPGDIIEYTDEYGDYSQNAHIQAFDGEPGQLSICTCPYVPFVFYEDDGQGVYFNTGGGPWTSVDSAALTYIGKREKLFIVFCHNILPGKGSVCFKATVNVWEHIAPDQKHPGYSTKEWARQFMSYVEKPHDGSEYRYYGNFNQGLVFKTATDLQHWKITYKAVGFPGESPNSSVLFHYREIDRLVSREEWDALDLPLDTRFVNGIIHVKVAYDDNAHTITVYRFTNSGYLDSKWFGEYARAKGIELVAPKPESKNG